MISMMEDFIGAYGNRLIVAVVGVGVALLILAIALWLLRRRSGSAPFIRGGRNRQPRLQVLDATAVDARRRLVLVRRDNVEHLVMIGGPTDIVIESGIGAIPIVRDVQEPELKALPRQESEQKRAEPAIQPERRPALPQQQPVAAAAPVSVPEEPVKQAQRPEPSAPAPSPRPAPVAAAAAQLPPRPSTQPQPVRTPAPARETAPPARQAAPERETARATPPPIPVATAPVAAVLPMAAASLDMAAARTEPRRAEPVVQAPAPVAPPIPAPAPVEAKAEERTAEFAPPVFAAREPVIDQSIAADFLDAARERVLPDLKPGQTTPPAPFPPKPENPAVASNDAEPKFSDELASDFESFLEAEIAKSKADNEPSIAPVGEKQIKPQPASPPVTGASPDGDMQKEMARIFGELSVTRDR
ncbi:MULTISPECIES: flagellar biosynthetic protein FliO [Agrobacterium]|uniref:flagellar biosynthetic protein FliO n=1 Tax=Agrobacterium TaxID=357 RepID=UPI0022B852B3|nr:MULTISPECIES: flagellar biosynthetic protein FliO [Agrobacterium]MCZ7886620.1 flagellar biosynthetic protein FliO [Agrobacterium salinitolerans]MDA5629045.1 flagellar biosynthetic protein FliO [Agrobacterium sp. ST15.16.055]MDA6979722.1 flagellar biosynthetic protein FliO [Agrobacterium salinitolerans]